MLLDDFHIIFVFMTRDHCCVCADETNGPQNDDKISAILTILVRGGVVVIIRGAIAWNVQCEAR